jgi:hypothetical protein
MPILDPLPPPSDGEENSALNSLPLQTQIEFARLRLTVTGLFDEAKIKLSSTNKDQIFEELQNSIIKILRTQFVDSKIKDDLVRRTMVGSYASPDEEKLSLVHQKYYQKGKMYWGRDEDENGILMLKLDSEDTWTPHTDDKWAELLSLSDRNRGLTIPGASNGIGEFQFLIKYMEWEIISKP